MFCNVRCADQNQTILFGPQSGPDKGGGHARSMTRADVRSGLICRYSFQLRAGGIRAAEVFGVAGTKLAGFAIFALNGFVDFLAMDRDVGRGFDA